MQVTLINRHALNLPDTLSPKERQAATQFKTELLRQRYCFAHNVKRKILSEYLGRPASALIFIKDAYGKPSVEGYPDCYFNLSHSGDWVAFAIGNQPVGIDIEYEKNEGINDIAKQILHPQEQIQELYAVWVLKEAILKANGCGLSVEPNSFKLEQSQHGYHACIKGQRYQAQYQLLQMHNLHLAMAQLNALDTPKIEIYG